MPARSPRGLRPSAAAVTLIVVVGVTGVATARPPGAGAGCDERRHAVAFRDGRIMQRQPPHAPVPCQVQVRAAATAGESQIAVTRDGTVAYQPAVDADGRFGVAVSRDLGRSWRVTGLHPNPTGGTDNTLWADPDTSRLFWVTGGGGEGEDKPFYGTIAYTDDDGGHWHYGLACCVGENPRLTTARPRTTHPRGYGKNVYFCSNTFIVGGAEPFVGARVCSTSTDGGSTYDSVPRTLFSKLVPQRRECLPNNEQFGALDGLYPQGAPDGSLYLVVVCDGVAGQGQNMFFPGAGQLPSGPATTYLERSVDDGATWTAVTALPVHTVDEMLIAYDVQLRVDSDGNLYLAYAVDATHLLLRTSTDHGHTWTAPANLLLPGTSMPTADDPVARNFPTLHHWSVAVRTPGHLAVSYLGQHVGGATLDNYLTATSQALNAHPTFWAAAVNDPAGRMHSAPPTLSANDYIEVAVAPDGTPWGGFFNGYVGRLAMPVGTRW